ncbi:TetR-like C-terminal domain-containing protein [Mycobacterium sp. 236(2023)]|uniref:TetR-like C-terminal domain-containing protein n=1 Tax=Mycobacterium sp. 236(2023) TaxID=3038163 RepID=UPI002415877A|nr:TetR-like C-terminal domain-containing protein [Mycobacterium sp. 236(2023)]MDG4668458.1 TetR-like C-terminal domain-containing protein [Mycobacterium sp. 236(2023)]
MSSQWDFVDSAVPQELRDRVLAAALDEVTHQGIDRFDVSAMAGRHGIDVQLIHLYWGSTQRLLLDTMFFRADDIIIAPDTGSLRSDLEAMALAVARYLNTSQGRRLQRAMVMDDRATHSDDTRTIFWRRRYETVRTILDQAAVRGELREGVNPLTAVQILLAPINIRSLYTDEPIDDAYCLSVAELAWRALIRR